MSRENIGENISFPSFLNESSIWLESSLVASAAADEAQDDEEDVDDVQVQLQRSKDVLLRAELVTTLLTADHHLCVEDEKLRQQTDVADNADNYLSQLF